MSQDPNDVEILSLQWYGAAGAATLAAAVVALDLGRRATGWAIVLFCTALAGLHRSTGLLDDGGRARRSEFRAARDQPDRRLPLPDPQGAGARGGGGGVRRVPPFPIVTPAKAGVQSESAWTPAFAGVTVKM